MGRKIENLEKLNVLMDSYIQCIQIPEELVDSVGNDVIDNNYLLKHTYFLAKLDLCNQIQHENYPSLVCIGIDIDTGSNKTQTIARFGK